MTTTPTLPPLPESMLRGLYGEGQMQSYALAAYHAGQASALSVISDDALAATCQSIGQYRTVADKRIRGNL